MWHGRPLQDVLKSLSPALQNINPSPRQILIEIGTLAHRKKRQLFIFKMASTTSVNTQSYGRAHQHDCLWHPHASWYTHATYFVTKPDKLLTTLSWAGPTNRVTALMTRGLRCTHDKMATLHQWQNGYVCLLSALSGFCDTFHHWMQQLSLSKNHQAKSNLMMHNGALTIKPYFVVANTYSLDMRCSFLVKTFIRRLRLCQIILACHMR
jgi:hypothetical protein